MNVILIGYRGCGKSTIGKLLAAQLGLPFLDVDQQITDRFGGITIKQIWQTHGEDAFRELEAVVLVELLNTQDNQVIALGGGSVIQSRGRNAVANAPHAVRIYLQCGPQELQKRVVADAKFALTRPNRPDPVNGETTIRQILAYRHPLYRSVADHIVDVTEISAEAAAARIARLVS